MKQRHGLLLIVLACTWLAAGNSAVRAQDLGEVSVPPVPVPPQDSLLSDVPGYEELRSLAASWNRLAGLMQAVKEFEDLPYQFSQRLWELRQDPIAGPLIDSLFSLYKDRYWMFSAYAATSGETPVLGAVSAGARVSWDAGLCRLFVAGVDSQAYADEDGSGTALAAIIGGCLPLPGNTVEFSFTSERGVRSSLLSRPTSRGGRYDAEIFDLALRFWRFRFIDHQVDIFPLSFTAEIFREDDGAGAEVETGQVDLAMSVVQWNRRKKGFHGADQRWLFVPIHIRSRAEDEADGSFSFDTNSVVISGARFEGVGFGNPMLGIDAEVGYLGAQLSEGQTTTLNHRRLYVDAAVNIGPPKLFGGLHYRHDTEPSFNDTFVQEHRLTTSMSFPYGKSLTAVEGFVARTQLVTEDSISSARWLPGGQVRYGYRLTEQLHAVAMAETAKSAFSNQWDRRLNLSLVGNVGTTSR